MIDSTGALAEMSRPTTARLAMEQQLDEADSVAEISRMLRLKNEVRKRRGLTENSPPRRYIPWVYSSLGFSNIPWVGPYSTI